MRLIIVFTFMCFQFLNCSPVNSESNQDQTAEDPKNQAETSNNSTQTAAEQLAEYLPLLEGKKVGVVTNHTAIVGTSHLVDTLLNLGVTIEKVFSPEHGFRGDQDAGAKVDDTMDAQTGLPIISLYGKNRKPSQEMLNGIDVLLFDIQDVGVRFYTYISTMHYTMEAAAEKGISYIVLDRPNPNGNYYDGPIRTEDNKSFVGMHPIPIVHGLTVGELAIMINEEGWLSDKQKVDLKVIPVKNYKHSDEYSLPVKPSPNLPNDLSIILYPSTCLFEGTVISVGRGTMAPFQQLGHPKLKGDYDFYFTPKSIQGMSSKPKYEGENCYGVNLKNSEVNRAFSLKYLIELYQAFPEKSNFFNTYFVKLAGTSELQEQIEAGLTEEEIRSSWKKELSEYAKLRSKYLIYEE